MPHSGKYRRSAARPPKRHFHARSAATTVEYIVIISVVGIALLLVGLLFGRRIAALFGRSTEALGAGKADGSAPPTRGDGGESTPRLPDPTPPPGPGQGPGPAATPPLPPISPATGVLPPGKGQSPLIERTPPPATPPRPEIINGSAPGAPPGDSP